MTLAAINSEIWTLLGTVIASIMAVAAAAYTANQSRRTSEATSTQAADVAERESQRKLQVEMLNLLKGEVESLNKRVVELRTRLVAAEDETDAERRRRREMEFEVDEMKSQLDRMKRILGDVVPTEARAQYPDLFPGRVVTPPVTPPAAS